MLEQIKIQIDSLKSSSQPFLMNLYRTYISQNRYDYCFSQDDSRKREAFMDMLAKRYPKYADKISTTGSEDGYPVRPHVSTGS